MPTRGYIQDEILKPKRNAQDSVRRKYLKRLSKHTKRDTILYASAFSEGSQTGTPLEALSITSGDISGFMAALHGLRNRQLDLILHSPGGYMEAAEQIVLYLRQKYEHIRVIVPQNAMSAATILACACDVIVMGKHSAIGPIDPQISIPSPEGMFALPAQAILDEFELGKREIQQAFQHNDQATALLWLERLRRYGPGILWTCMVTLERGKEKVAEWLENYMFRGQPDAAQKAADVADWLSNANLHKSHSKPIGIQECQKHGLKVEPLEHDQQLQDLVLSVFHATMVTFQVTSCVKIIENHNGRGTYLQVQPVPVPMPTSPPNP